eukprot:SAG31_NODE_210_length_20286_cov_22.684748_14_plen_94_part_00
MVVRAHPNHILVIKLRWSSCGTLYDAKRHNFMATESPNSIYVLDIFNSAYSTATTKCCDLPWNVFLPVPACRYLSALLLLVNRVIPKIAKQHG